MIYSRHSGCLSASTPISLAMTSVFSRAISSELPTNIHHVILYCRKGFQGQRSKIKVIGGEMYFPAD